MDDSGEGKDKVPDNLSETSSVVTAKGRVSPVPSSNVSNPSSTPTSASLRGRFGSMTHMKINEDGGLESNGKGGELGAGVPVPDGSEAVMGSETGEEMSLGGSNTLEGNTKQSQRSLSSEVGGSSSITSRGSSKLASSLSGVMKSISSGFSKMRRPSFSIGKKVRGAKGDEGGNVDTGSGSSSGSGLSFGY